MADVNADERYLRNIEGVNLTEEQIAELREAFFLFDHDGDGCVASKDVRNVVKSLIQYPTEQDLEALANKVEQMGGSIDFPAFLDLMAGKMKSDETTTKCMLDALKALDGDGDGYLSKEEMRVIIDNLGDEVSEQEMEQLMRAFDMDGDAYLTAGEFMSMLTDMWRLMSATGPANNTHTNQLASNNGVGAWEPCGENPGQDEHAWFKEWKEERLHDAGGRIGDSSPEFKRLPSDEARAPDKPRQFTGWFRARKDMNKIRRDEWRMILDEPTPIK